MPTIRELVFTALDNACNNGYRQQMRCLSPQAIAHDLIDHDADVGEAVDARKDAGQAVAELVIAIKAWRAEKDPA